jgi:hypothetical protein
MNEEYINDIYNNEDDVVAYVVNKRSGKTTDYIKEGDKIKHKETNKKKEEYLRDHEIDFNDGVPFVKLYKGMNNLRKYLTTGEFTIAVSLADYVSYEDCVIRRGGHHNGKILTIKELAEEMEIEYDSLRRTITSLVKKGVLGIHKTGCKDNPKILIKAITVNPYIYNRGKDVSKTALSLFSHTKWND